MKRTSRRISGEQGQSIITLALAAMFFVCLIAVVADTMLVWWQRRDLQNTADAAALAGAQELNGLSTSESPAMDAAHDWADKNVTGLTFFEPVVSENYTQIKVTVKKNAKSLFGGSLGFNNPEVSAKATARVRAPLLPGPGVVPLAVDEDTYDFCLNGNNCSDIQLKEWSGSNTDPPSDYHLLDLPGGNGANDVCNFLIGGGTQPIQDPVSNEPGNVSSLHNCLVERMDAATANSCLTLDDVLDSDGKLEPRCNPLDGASKGSLSSFPDAQPSAVILVPVIKDFCKGSCDLDIVGDGTGVERTFAFFWINPDTVYGTDPTCLGGSGGGNGGGSGNGGGGGTGAGQCEIHGQFIQGYYTTLVTDFNSDNGEFDPNSLVKIVQLID